MTSSVNQHYANRQSPYQPEAALGGSVPYREQPTGLPQPAGRSAYSSTQFAASPASSQPAPTAPGAGTCAQFHNVIADAGHDLISTFQKTGKVAGYTAAVLGGLGAGAGVGVVTAASLGALASLAATVTAPPIAAAIIGVPLIVGVILGTLIRTACRRHVKRNPLLAAKITTLKEIQRRFADLKDPSPGELGVLEHVNCVLKKLNAWGAVRKDLVRHGVAGVVTGVVSGVLVVCLILLAVAGGGDGISCGGGGGGGGGTDIIVMPYYGWGYSPWGMSSSGSFAFTSAGREAKRLGLQAQRDQNAAAPARVSLEPEWEQRLLAKKEAKNKS